MFLLVPRDVVIEWWLCVLSICGMPLVYAVPSAMDAVLLFPLGPRAKLPP